MNTKTYENVTVKEEKGSVILSAPSMTRPLIIPRNVWRAILADNVKEVMKGNSEPSEPYTYHSPNVTFPNDSTTEEV